MNAATEVRDGYELDLTSLEVWMRANIDGFAGTLSIEQFSGGQSNPTYRLSTTEREYVLRKQPPGHLLRGAHAVDREARVQLALGTAGFPVAQVHGLCTDPAILGTPFYVMDMVQGRIFWDCTIPGVPNMERAALFDAMNDTISALHNLDFAALGLAEYGRTGNYFERQITRWSRQYLEDSEAGRDPYMDKLVEWLPANIPSDDDATSIVHGDFRIDNLIFHPDEARVSAVIDWELSTLGHPGADFAYHAMMYRMPPHIVAGLSGSDIAALGILPEKDYVAAYCARRGLEELPNYGFYVAFNFFRLAAIFHGIKGRVIRGSAASAQARDRVAVLPELTRLAWLQVERL